MSGFSSQWLGLREPVDHASRNLEVQNAMLDGLKQRHGDALQTLRIIDLGCGSGSNLRALAPLFGQEQHWTLVDHDAELLAVAKAQTRQWADSIVHEGADQWVVQRAQQTLSIRFRQADLNHDLQTVLGEGRHDLVTAAALFDLISPEWIARFCDVLDAPFYTVLTYDGRSVWRVPAPEDEALLAAFHQHQQTDKGFGAAAGPEAARVLAQCLQTKQWTVVRGDSTWHLNNSHRDLLQLLHEGMAQAAREVGSMSEPQLASWLASRHADGSCEVGHEDTFAMPPSHLAI